MAEMRKLTAYFSLLSGNSRWDENAERIFDDLFHKDVTIVGVQKRCVQPMLYDCNLFFYWVPYRIKKLILLVASETLF